MIYIAPTSGKNRGAVDLSADLFAHRFLCLSFIFSDFSYSSRAAD